MTKKFGDQVLGVHGAEMPKFADATDDREKHYWIHQKGYNAKPPVQSLNVLQ